MITFNKVLEIILIIFVPLYFVFIFICEIMKIKDAIRCGEDLDYLNLSIMICIIAIAAAIIFREKIFGFLEFLGAKITIEFVEGCI